MRSTTKTGRRSPAWKYAIATGIAACAGACATAADFEPERLKDGAALPAAMPPVYVADFSIGHLMDGRITVLDGRTGKYAGVVDGGYAGHFTVAPDGRQLYVATTYLSRHTHGERHDVVEIYDASTLRITGDVELPPKRAQALYQQILTRTSFDGRYLFVQNATPATSVSVVDLQAKTLLAEVPTAGCFGIYPSSAEALRFSLLCGDGKIATVTLDAQGRVAQRAVTDKFFDSGSNPLFSASVSRDGRYYFVSFSGTLYRADLRGAQPVVENQVPFVTAADRKHGWRPGGYQLLALDAERGHLLVGMHPNGKEGSHKNPAREVWTLDLASGKRVGRTKVDNAIALNVARGGTHYLYAVSATNQLSAYELPTLRRVFVTPALGEALTQVDAP